MTKHIMFTYGTLKRGYSNNELCLAGAKFLGNAVSVEANFIMKHIGFPILWNQKNAVEGDNVAARVAGELYEINDEQLARCDRLEGHPLMYKREERRFFLYCPDTPEEITAWVYLWNRARGGDPVPLNGLAYDWWSPYPGEDDDQDDDQDDGDTELDPARGV